MLCNTTADVLILDCDFGRNKFTNNKIFDVTGLESTSVAKFGLPLLPDLQTEPADFTNFFMCLLRIFVFGLN